MSFNKNNPKAMDKIMDYLKQLSEMGGSEQSRRGQSEEDRGRQRGNKYVRVPSRATLASLSASTTCTSLAESCGSQGTLAPNFSVIPEHSTESESEDEDTFENTRLHFQQLRQISLGNEFKYKMEMEIKANNGSAKDENLRNSVPYVNQLSSESNKPNYAINGDAPVYPPTTQKLYLYTQIFAAFAVSMGSLIVGFSSGYTSPALPSMNETLQFSPEEESWVGGLMPLAALIGGVVGGPLIEYVGRRFTIMGTALPYFVGWMLIANASHIYMVFAGRALCGICVGIGSLSFPVYLGETIQPEVRGTLGLLPTAFGNIGILLAFLAGTYLNWSHLAFIGAALPVPFFILMLFTPETPRWYAMRNRYEDAKKALTKLRGENTNIDREIHDLTLSQTAANRSGGPVIKQLFASKYTRSVLIALGLMLFQQLSGINAVVFYASKIFEMAGSTIDKNLSSIIIGLVNFVSTFIAAAIVDRLGRKLLLYISSITMIITLIALGSYFYVRDIGVDVTTFSWLPLASLVLYVLGFSIGFGPIPWLMLGEILPSKIRGTAASLATGFNWTCTFIVTKTFQNIIAAIHMYGTVWLFASFCILGLFFVIFFVPETRGKSLEEIEKKLTGGSKKVHNIRNKKSFNVC